MSTRIGNTGISTQLNPFGPQWNAGQAKQASSVGEQIQKTLFGKPKPVVLDASRFPELARLLGQLKNVKKKLATMAGDKEDDYDIVLADGTIAMIDEEGVIYMGRAFMSQFADEPGVLVGALAHEIGHRPKRWAAYKTQRELSKEELETLCRHEETRADIFAGKALAELGLDCEPLIAFLKAVEEGPHPDYFPAEVRGEVIKEAHAGRAYRARARKALFPAFDRMTSPKGHLGEY